MTLSPTALCPLHPEYRTPYPRWLRQILGMSHPGGVWNVSSVFPLDCCWAAVWACTVILVCSHNRIGGLCQANWGEKAKKERIKKITHKDNEKVPVHSKPDTLNFKCSQCEAYFKSEKGSNNIQGTQELPTPEKERGASAQGKLSLTLTPRRSTGRS